MASNHLHEVLGRAILDQAFRQELFKNPKAACEKAGLPLQSHQYAQISAFDKDTFETAIRDLGTTGGSAG
jgi:hypothetical protein